MVASPKNLQMDHLYQCALFYNRLYDIYKPLLI